MDLPRLDLLSKEATPFGNEYHTACCAKSGILFSMEIVEGKDAPPNRRLAYDNLGGKTTGLLLRMLESYFHTGKYVVLDSGFCVLKSLIELNKKGRFGCALIKKRRYWPTLVPGEAIDARFNDKAVGDFDSIQGKSDDNITYFLWAMKEPDYVMKLMATGGKNERCTESKESEQKWTENGQKKHVKFHYPYPVKWHFLYRHQIDDHNNLRHAVPSIEESWNTRRWEIREFSFILAVCEGNAFLALRYFCYPGNITALCPTFLKFRMRLAFELINNKYIGEEEEEDPHIMFGRQHELKSAPNHAKKYANRRWDCSAKYKYQAYYCRMKCGKKTREYCACNPGSWICKRCHAQHVVSASNEV